MAKIKNKYVTFVSDQHFLACVRYVCEGYPKECKSFEIEQLQRNALDPFKMLFDIANQKIVLDAWISNEKVRQADKTLNNRIGEFHQKLLGGVNGWTDLGTGDKTKVDLKRLDNSVFIELKNKFNTVNYDSKSKVREKLEKMARTYPNATVYWAYILDRRGSSTDQVWVCNNKRNPRIRCITGKKVYALVTGKPNALDEVWQALPRAIEDVLQQDIAISEVDRKKLTDFFNLAFRG